MPRGKTWNPNSMKQLGGRYAYNSRRQAIARARRKLVSKLLQRGYKTTAIIIWLSINAPMYPQSESTVQRDIKHIRKRWVELSACPGCGRPMLIDQSVQFVVEEESDGQ